jgi:hypothetical protein
MVENQYQARERQLPRQDWPGMYVQARADEKDVMPSPEGYILGDYIDLIDEFYPDPANVRLTIFEGWLMIEG